MSEVTPLMLDVAKYLTLQLREEISTPRPSRTYAGMPKPISGRYPTPVSPRIASGNLVRQTKVVWVEGFSFDDAKEPTMAIDFGTAEDYAEYVDRGRRPGKYPPLYAIDRWVTQKKGMKGIRNSKGQFISRKSQVFLIRRSIGEHGYYGINFIDKAIEKSLNKIQQDLGQAAEEFLLKYLEKNKTLIPL